MPNYTVRNIVLGNVNPPKVSLPDQLPVIPDHIYSKHLDLLIDKMQENSLDAVVIYSDREHFSNFNYIVGFDPRFEEGVLVVHKDKSAFVLLGNECFSLHKLSRVKVSPLLCQQLSLPNQPNEESKAVRETLRDAGIRENMKIGVAGWKLFTCKEESEEQFCVPSFIVDALASIAGKSNLSNATPLFIDPGKGIRMINQAEEIAYYEFGAAIASKCVQDVVDGPLAGLKETEIAARQVTCGLPASCHSMLSVGKNVFRGLVSPTTDVARHGDPITQSVGLRGGLSVRNGYIDGDADNVSADATGFVEKAGLPYFTAVVAWLETIGIGVTGGELFDLVNNIIPKEKYGWVLNPGHSIADEEWLCSPVYPGSTVSFKSGMLIQLDFIPSVEGYVSPNCEDGFCIADEILRTEIQNKYPDMWKRMQLRREYMIHEIGINLKREILPMSNIAGYYRPYFLNKTLAFKVQGKN
ncbi:M24 family metallopeptidase [Caproiciproducens sp. R1]|uniref:M24 family metallopeptidase n=1 Tax=Caproiciproducens sp. R1 TaxID=3435000 RepID=UPI00403394C0